MGLNPVQAWIFFKLRFHNYLSCCITAMINHVFRYHTMQTYHWEITVTTRLLLQCQIRTKQSNDSVQTPLYKRLTWNKYSKWQKRKMTIARTTTDKWYNKYCSLNEHCSILKAPEYLSNRNLTTWRLKFSGTVLLNQRLKPMNRPMAVNIFRRLVWNKHENMTK